MLVGIASNRSPGRSRFAVGQGPGSGNRQERSNAGGDPIGKVVQPSRCPSEVPVPVGAVPDHAIGGVQHLVGEQPRQAADQKPQGRCHHAVGKVLSRAFDRCPAHAFLVQGTRIATDNRRHCTARTGQPVRQKGIGNGRHVVVERALCQQHSHNRRLQKGPQQPQAIEHSDDKSPDTDGCHQQHDYRGDAHVAST